MGTTQECYVLFEPIPETMSHKTIALRSVTSHLTNQARQTKHDSHILESTRTHGLTPVGQDFHTSVLSGYWILPGAMEDMDRWQERIRDLRAISTT